MSDCTHDNETPATTGDGKHVWLCTTCGRTRPHEPFAPFGPEAA